MSEDAQMIRWGFLAELVKQASENNEWEIGKTAIQKLVYLYQQLSGDDLGYEYRYHSYGPYSEMIADDVDLLKYFGVLKVEYRDGPQYPSYEISPAADNKTIQKHWEQVSSSKIPRIKALTATCKGKKARELEAVATIAYIQRHYKRRTRIPKNEDRKKKLYDDFIKLKPKYSETEFDTALSLLDKLRAKLKAAQSSP